MLGRIRTNVEQTLVLYKMSIDLINFQLYVPNLKNIAFPIRIRPKSGPEARFPAPKLHNIKYNKNIPVPVCACVQNSRRPRPYEFKALGPWI